MNGRTGQGNGQDFREAGPRSRSLAALVVLAISAALLFAGFVALGTWQVHRLQWKRALIERVEQRVHAAPVAAPGPDRWPHITAESDEYRHVRVEGNFLPQLSTLVQATTVRGSGYWLMTPLRDGSGRLVLINRGFVSQQAAGHIRERQQSTGANSTEPGKAPAESAPIVVTGLLRISEPGGGFLRENDPAQDKWYSRDVQAIAAARGLTGVAPYFIDADAASPEQVQSAASSSDEPVGGLTVISFHNNHLIYALTWYGLALMVAAAGAWIIREHFRNRHSLHSPGGNEDRNTADGRDD
ncbi:surfeit locus 1 family protein [Paucimonas lemoignei]|uniref:SURF1-like protein n=1 Tax=Paucimonas lemoignei TaxID=29443 RepID=A0A4R3I1I2_PAULE|nr:SURF1 family protein [Paucimonas lemoignei]TCS39438.1 surfeit locus 1 family protein [Paucimonas lemoignei]